MKTKPLFLTILVSQEEIDKIDSEWRPNLEYKSRTDYIRSRLGMKRTSIMEN